MALSTIQPIGFVLSGISLGIDAISGGIYNCTKILKPKFSNILTPKEPKPRKIFIIPPYHLDEIQSNKIIEIWMNQQFIKNKKEKEQIIPPTKIKRDLEYLGITNERHITPKKMKKRFLLRLGHKFQFTHILYLKVKENKNKYIITPYLYDAFNLKQVKSKYQDKFYLPKSDYLLKTGIRWMLKAITILPNTFQLGINTQPEINISSNVFDIPSLDKDHDGNIETNRHPDSIPKILTSLSIGVVENPHHFNTWDISFSIFPNFSSSSWLSEFKNDQEKYSIQLYNFNAFLNAGINFHTIMGALGINIGAGAVWFIGEDSLGRKYNYIDKAMRVSMNYVAFISERFYFRGDFSNYELMTPKITNTRYTLNSWNEFYLGIGYYFPSLRTIVRNILPF